MTTDEALEQLGESTRDAVVNALQMFAPGGVETGPVTPVPHGAAPLASVSFPAVATNVSYVDGVSGGNLFVMARVGARKLAAAMMGSPTDEIADDELSELELSAVGEAMNQMMAAAAAATSSVLEEDVEISWPDTRILSTTEDATGFVEDSPHATSVRLTVLGEPCLFVQLVPTAFVLRMTRALAQLEGEDADQAELELAASPAAPSGDSIRTVPLRVSAELGRTRMAIGDAVRLWRGAVVELAEPADTPLDVMVNGQRFAHGRLVVLDDGQWGIRIERVLAAPATEQAAIEASN